MLRNPMTTLRKQKNPSRRSVSGQKMLVPLRSKLDQMKIVLGSHSPRRRELLAPFFAFDVVPSNFDESTISPSSFATPSEFVRVQAQKKCEELAGRLTDADMTDLTASKREFL
jgi:hypothetical protein